MMQTAPAVDWDDVGGLRRGVHRQEAAVLPLLIPDFFTGIREPWKGVLLFGPPGTGKTMLAKAVAATGKCAFFACSPAALLSKCHGESEKLRGALRGGDGTTSVLFFDEIDALLSTRGAANEHEACRRLKSELLTLIDGVNTGGGEGGKIDLVLAATNDMDLDEAMPPTSADPTRSPTPPRARRSSASTSRRSSSPTTSTSPPSRRAPTATAAPTSTSSAATRDDDDVGKHRGADARGDRRQSRRRGARSRGDRRRCGGAAADGGAVGAAPVLGLASWDADVHGCKEASPMRVE